MFTNTLFSTIVEPSFTKDQELQLFVLDLKNKKRIKSDSIDLTQIPKKQARLVIQLMENSIEKEVSDLTDLANKILKVSFDKKNDHDEFIQGLKAKKEIKVKKLSLLTTWLNNLEDRIYHDSRQFNEDGEELEFSLC